MTSVISDEELQRDIINNIIKPTYKKEIERLVADRKRWNKASNVLTTISYAFIGGTTLTSSLSAIFPQYPVISITGTVLGLCSLVFAKYSHFCDIQSTRSLKDLNSDLKKLGIQFQLDDYASQHQIQNSDNTNITGNVNDESQISNRLNGDSKVNVVVDQFGNDITEINSVTKNVTKKISKNEDFQIV